MLLELPHNSSLLKGSACFATRGKKDWQNHLRLFCRFDHYFFRCAKNNGSM